MQFTKNELEILEGVKENLTDHSGSMTNYSTGRSVWLEQEPMTLYEYILGCVLLDDEAEERKAIELFRKLYPEQHQVLFEKWDDLD